MLSLNELWFVLVAVLFVGFFFLEGFDFGVGMSTQFLARTDGERRVLINSIGPFWDANEVWLLTAGGAMFAAFPNWYATLFSGYYVPLVAVLLALIVRGVAFEFRGKVDSERWKKTWDLAIFVGSLLPPFLFGVVFAGLIKGLPIDQQMEMKAGLFDMVNLYTLVGGITVTVLCLVHGLMFTTLRTEGDLQARARRLGRKLMIPLAALLVLFAVMTYFMTDVFQVRGAILAVVAVLGLIVFLLAGYFMKQKKDGWAFGMTGGIILLSIASVFIGLFPRVMISSINSAFDLTIHNAASGAYSLKVMTIVAVTLLPFVLGYQIWSYFVFHKRVNEKQHLEY
ncbi:cytochrome d ubiquinol oxidase subunit II [Paenibacillus dendritiformis]|uniref:Cytochrome d ubiquinol oxidase subunit II n=1 Tax=Paenibacillus dendritiformis C454 TaxID=1131935 RepID=H3SDT6_9BACL|nr:cytochrome d ubiquinol oxidase subunit II [Paenibacillus dendritiformis]EHQ62773.1 cytochrome d ubiquinol oxidase subunit II [Paenibacillus dendritiformis C454]PZM62393.1 cytochrome d ubiquinol oxidase subunit II [Paenibacillus dendritiformis]TDL47951.1 cytochrome d ubiquinol oxidase subunit II [Paenibacillus dendritiformis]WGU93497.1 cytochrome d ubiquinol oxidase subunit II [Paenibacillus dendritiformis]CAH8767673.1 cytochrome d ubiquinol oxidase subunit II [Paenibacillus dendritiformis]